MQNILFDNSLGINAYTGIGYVSRLILYILIKEGHDISMFSPNKKGLETIQELWNLAKNNSSNINILSTSYTPYKLNSIYRYYDLNDSFVDTIFCPFQFPLKLKRKEKDKNIKLKFIVHDLCYLEKGYYPFYNSQIKKYILTSRIKNLFSDSNTTIFTPREPANKKLKKMLNGNSNSIKTLNMPYFFGNEWSDIDKNIFLTDYDKPFVLFISNSRSNKKIDLFLNLVNNLDNVNFIVVGDAKLKILLKKFNNITFKQNISEEEITALIIRCSLLLSTSKCEGFCLPVCRANFIGKPVALLPLDIYKNKEFEKMFFIDINNIQMLEDWIRNIISYPFLINYNFINERIKTDKKKLSNLISQLR